MGNGKWINDKVMDFILPFIVLFMMKDIKKEKIHMMSAFYYTSIAANREVKHRVQIFDKEVLFIPVHLAMHWVLAVVFHPNKLKNTKAKGPHPYILILDSWRGKAEHVG